MKCSSGNEVKFRDKLTYYGKDNVNFLPRNISYRDLIFILDNMFPLLKFTAK